MANHKSAEKRARQSLRRNLVNSSRRSVVRTAEKALLKALSAKDSGTLSEQLKGLLKNYMSEMGKAAKNNVFKKTTASRKISRLSSRVHQATGSK